MCKLQSLESCPGGGNITKEDEKEKQVQSRIRNPDEETHQEASSNSTHTVDVSSAQCNQEGTGNEAEAQSPLTPHLSMQEKAPSNGGSTPDVVIEHGSTRVSLDLDGWEWFWFALAIIAISLSLILIRQ